MEFVDQQLKVTSRFIRGGLISEGGVSRRRKVAAQDVGHFHHGHLFRPKSAKLGFESSKQDFKDFQENDWGRGEEEG